MINSESGARAYVQSGWGGQAAHNCALLVEHLRRENAVQNLVSKTTLADAWVRHIADSAQLLQHAPQGTRSWIDIGSGAGFPGLVVAILQRDWTVTLIEPRRLRVAWLQAMCAELRLTNCIVVQAVAEHCQVPTHDVVSARAVSDLTDLLEMSSTLGHAQSRWIFAKGRNALTELEAVPPQLSAQFVFHVKHSLTASDAHIIVAQRAKGPG